MEETMKTLIAASMLALTLAPAAAQEMDYGQAEYLNSCASCHGQRGLGNGPLAEELRTPPADLTVLSTKSGGNFPYWRVFAIIDGRYVVPGHGERDMPVWGRQFLEDDAKVFGPNGGEIVTTERIHELTVYIESLQR
jgi:mono/diheme cytochrome c family protein